MYIIEARKGSFIFYWTGSAFSGERERAWRTDMFARAVIETDAANKAAKADGFSAAWIEEG